MSKLGNIDWEQILLAECKETAKGKGLELEVDPDVVGEVRLCAETSLHEYKLRNPKIAKPNSAKIAGHLCYWLCRLKPVQNAPGAKIRYRAANEEVALRVGLSICQEYFDDLRADSFRVDPCIVKDWVTSLRYDLDSPNALSIAFELLSGRRVH
jgi:hypothetical protein